MENKGDEGREEKIHEFGGTVDELQRLCIARGFQTKSLNRKYIRGRLNYLHNLYIDAHGLLNYRGRENIKDIKSFLHDLLQERHIQQSDFGNNYESIIGFLSGGGAGGNHWDYTFEQHNNVDDEDIIMRMRYVDRNDHRIPLLEKPSRIIITEQKEIVHQLRNFIANNDIHADNQFGYFNISVGTRITLQNTQTGETMEGGFPELNRTVEISNNEAVRSWIEELSEILEQREQGFIKDGYDWRIIDFEGFDILFSPRTEHRNIKRWSRRNKGEQEAQKKKKARIENEAREQRLFSHDLRIGRMINLPNWWFRKVGYDIVTDKNDCVYKAILRSVIKKHKAY